MACYATRVMTAVRRHSSCELLSVTSTPLDEAARVEGHDLELCILASDVEDEVGAFALATLTRPRRAVHEEIWMQLFVDDTFIDVTRVSDVSDEGDGDGRATFLGRMQIPAIYFDGQEHRARVKFVNTISRVVPRGTGMARMPDPPPEAVADADFVATMGRARRRDS